MRIPFLFPFVSDHIVCGAETMKNEEIEASGVDISDSGIGLISDSPLAKDEVLRLELPLPTAKATPPAFAVVVWLKPHDKRTRAGLRFLV